MIVDQPRTRRGNRRISAPHRKLSALFDEAASRGGRITSFTNLATALGLSVSRISQLFGFPMDRVGTTLKPSSLARLLGAFADDGLWLDDDLLFLEYDAFVARIAARRPDAAPALLISPATWLPDPAGVFWRREGKFLAINRTPTPEDRVAADPLADQLQQAIAGIAAQVPSAAGLHLALAAALPQRVDAAIWLLCLEAGQHAAPPPTVLDDLLRAGAVWQRGIPSLVAWRKATEAALFEPALLAPAQDLLALARAQGAIAPPDAAMLTSLAAATHPHDPAGRRAAAAVVASLRNLLSVLAAEGSDLLATPLAAAFATQPAPPPFAFALASPQTASSADAEARARQHLLEGRAPPAAWVGAVRSLDFRGTGLRDISQFGALTALRSLQLGSTAVRDLAPLGGLAGLLSLGLDSTGVTDLAPLIGLAALRTLDLRDTAIADITPLAGLIDLHSLDLSLTQVSELAPLSGLLALRSLSLVSSKVRDLADLPGLRRLQVLLLAGTDVADITPLAGLLELQSLSLNRTRVADLRPLTGLVALRTLNLAGASIENLAELARLASLQTLDLEGCAIADLAPLAGLRALQTLVLRGTAIVDLRPLASLTTLRSLDLQATLVTDLTPLTGLRALETLDLRETGVTDLAPLASLTGLQTLVLRGTKLRDLSPLAGLIGLRTLDLRGTGIINAGPLAHLAGTRIALDRPA